MKSKSIIYRIICLCLLICRFAIPSDAIAAPQIMKEEPEGVYCDSVDGIRAKAIGIYIEEVATGKVVYDVNGEVPMVPASITKVVTAASYFSKEDINRQFITNVYLEGVVSDSVLTGNIIIAGDGDPTLESRHFKGQAGMPDSVAAVLKRRGITRVTGRVIVERPDWIGTTQPKGWESADFTWGYGAGYQPVNFADNTMTVTLSRNEMPECNPCSPGSTFHRITGKGSRVERKRDSAEYTFSHSGRKPNVTTIANGDPESSLIYAVIKSIESEGIELEEEDVTTESSERELLLTHRSAPMGEILESLLLRSDNMMAEAMLRQLAPGESRADALAVQKKMWSTRDIDYRDIVIEDGSGLSRTNRITPYFMADVLIWMLENRDDFMTFCNYLPLSGKSGTLRSFLKDTPLEGRLRAKTGSMNGVQCYAGYATDELGVPTHIVVIMVNGFECDRAVLKKYLERVLIEKIG
ncbi:MAG: D-alanyl-D-alanine carboxypeptidase/D-alanyl-D-alanine-endopeptidase [Paramuribaculum sp.]|nr:D-alanyl-D-alanine carboxypeptidase/D-alanyl-D-alanine-endopeptidase [Paramuribaculum sp.]